MISNFVYEKEGARHRKVMRYRDVLPHDRIFTWQETKRFKIGQYLLMHSMIYRTELLRRSGLRLPAHTFYVDNLFAYFPMQYVKTMYYLDVNLYRYYIGRQDQSVNETVMIKRIDQQIKVNQMMMDGMKLDWIKNKELRNYLFHYLEIVTTVSSIMLLRSKTDENLQKKKELWEYIKKTDRDVYGRMRWGMFGLFLNLPGFLGRKIPVGVYLVARKVVGFN